MFAGRYGQPEEVAGVVEFLAINPASNYITGQVLIYLLASIYSLNAEFVVIEDINISIICYCRF